MKLSRSRLLRTVIVNQRASNPLYAGVISPVIAPSMGSDILTGWDFTSGWNKAVGNETINSATSFTTGASTGGLYKNIGLVPGTWYKYTITHTDTNNNLKSVNGNGGSTPLIRDGSGDATVLPLNPTVGPFLYLRDADTADTVNVSVLKAESVTFTSMRTLLGTHPKNGIFVCKPTIAAYSHCGMIINYADDDNFVLAIHDRTNAQLYKKLSGTWTKLIDAAGAYAAERELKVIADGGSYGLYYNNVQIGTNQAIVETTLGEGVYGFNALAGNTVGLVTANPLTDGGDLSQQGLLMLAFS